MLQTGTTEGLAVLPRPAQLLLTLTSPYGRKCRMVALEKQIDLPISLEPPHAAGSRIPALNPLAKIPTLLLDNGEPVHDSRVIVDYLEAFAPTPQLIPADAYTRMQVLRWQSVADGLADAMVLLFIEGQRPADLRDDAWTTRQRAKIKAGVTLLEISLSAENFLVGGSITVADLAIVAALDYVGLRGSDLFDDAGPRTRGWLAWMNQRPSVAGTAPPRA